MSISAVSSVTSFSIVLAETFGAVALSTLVPNAFVESANAVKRLAADAADADKDDAMSPLGAIPGVDAVVEAVKQIADATDDPTDMHILLPKNASIDAEFEFHGQESYQAGASVGGQVQIVTINAGYSALYTARSSNKVKLHIDFETVAVKIGG
jgi:hypothetical protein